MKLYVCLCVHFLACHQQRSFGALPKATTKVLTSYKSLTDIHTHILVVTKKKIKSSKLTTQNFFIIIIIIYFIIFIIFILFFSFEREREKGNVSMIKEGMHYAYC